MHNIVTKKLSWSMIFVLLFSWSGIPRYASNVHAATPRAAQLDELVDKMEKMFKALEAAQRETPRDTFDPKAIVAKVGKDPVKLFEWVRDNTYLVPYRGALRGHVGVLMDRLGNSLDRALLLGELLRLAGHKVQLAHAKLSGAEARKLLKEARPIPKGGVALPQPPSRQEMEDRVKKYAKDYGLDAKELRKVMAQQTLKSQQLAEETVQRVADQAPVIAKAVEKYRIKQDPASVELQREDAVSDHWWVQLHNGSGWVDLDPTLPDAQPGQPFTKSKAEGIVPHGVRPRGDQEEEKDVIYVDQAATQQGKTDLSFEVALPGDLKHRVYIRVVIERWENGRLIERPVLQVALAPLNWIGQRITLHHAPVSWPKDLNLFKENEPLKGLKSAVLAQREWIPILSVGDYRIHKLSFTDSGQLNDPSLPFPAVAATAQIASAVEKGAKALGEDIGGIIFGGTIGNIGMQRGPREKPKVVDKPKGKAQLTAEWIEYEIHVPGKKPQKIRREIFDLVGPASRSTGKQKQIVSEADLTEAKRLDRGLALLGQTEILPLISQLSPQFVEHIGAENSLTNRELLLSLLRIADSTDPESFAEQASKLVRMPGHLYSLALARRGWSRVRGDVYLDRPNVVTYHTRLRQSPHSGLLLFQGFDIVANNVAVRHESDLNPFLVRLEQGVLDTSAEAFLAAGRCLTMQSMADCREVENTSELFARSREQGIKWLTIRDALDPAWQSVELPNDVLARIKQELTDYVVVVPKRPVAVEGRILVGWWRIDRKTGQALGVGDQGWGTASWDYVMTISGVAIVSTVICVYIALFKEAIAPGTVPVSAPFICAGTVTVTALAAPATLAGLIAILLSGIVIGVGLAPVPTGPPIPGQIDQGIQQVGEGLSKEPKGVSGQLDQGIQQTGEGLSKGKRAKAQAEDIVKGLQGLNP